VESQFYKFHAGIQQYPGTRSKHYALHYETKQVSVHDVRFKP